MTFIDLAVFVLASYRLTHLITIEDGPGKTLRRLRIYAGAYQIADGSWQAETFFGKLLSCFMCASVWVAALLYGVYVYLPGAWWAIVILAIAGAACLLYRLGERPS